MADKDDDDYESVAAMADRLQLTKGDRQRYIHKHMTGLGYRMEPSYVPRDDDDDDNDDDDDFFPRQRRRRTSRDDDRSRGGRRQDRSHDEDGWYR